METISSLLQGAQSQLTPGGFANTWSEAGRHTGISCPELGRFVLWGPVERVRDVFFLLSRSRRAVSQHTSDLWLWWGRCPQTVQVMDVQRSGNEQRALGSAPGVTMSFNLGSVCTVHCSLALRYLCFRQQRDHVGRVKEPCVSEVPIAPCQRWWWLLFLAPALVTTQGSTVWVLLV